MKDFLVDPLLDLKSYENLLENIKSKTKPISVHGLLDENFAQFCYALKQHTNKQILVITYEDMKARNIYDDLNSFHEGENLYIFPRKEMLYYDVDAFSSERTHQRISVLSKLREDKMATVITSIDALLDKIVSKTLFYSSSFKVSISEELDLNVIISNLITSGYERVPMVESIGQFSLRGGILDIFPANSKHPYRIELFDEEVDSIRSFDHLTQRSLEVLEEIVVYPVKELLIPDKDKLSIAKLMENDLIKYEKKNNERKASDTAVDKFSKYIEALRDGNHINNVDMILPYLSEDSIGSFLDYMLKDSIVIIDEPRRILETADRMMDSFNDRVSELFGIGELLSSHFNMRFTYEYIKGRLLETQLITSSTFLKQDNDFPPKSLIQFTCRTMAVYHGKLDILKEDLERYLYRGYKIVILSGTEDRGLRLKDTLDHLGIVSEYHSSRNIGIKSNQIFITPGTLKAGFEYEGNKLAIISDREIYGSSRKRSKTDRKKARKKEKTLTFGDLSEGDFVVHENYGIGQYLGVEQLNIQGIRKDYLKIQYKGKDRLYLPIEQMGMIQKFIGSDSIKPKINKLSGSEWSKTKTRTKKAIEEMAMDLLELYAKREKLKGYQFSADTPWQNQFEDMFPYEETEGQLSSIIEIKNDMEKPKPMDRLLCGDVGYGKTEVALRAAFKAIMESKQVAILVPTTILAQQHYNTMVDRFGNFPIKMEMLSRFRSTAQQKATVEGLRKGLIDIVVGTHRLLSKDVLFKDLGLLIIDEEQRFGVKHKETLKKIKESVDVLTLTATPIPRTLHMSLVGIRDMSVIENPPEERYPIQTYVTENNKTLIRDAILKEVERGGQVYFVYNRVETIDKVTMELQQLVPEATFTIGHGQMSEKQLENVMFEFMNKEKDVLVCTTIIETGLDIPNVNTIIIHDADKMGLSQLYQLRGRVGRSNRIAYAYFIYEKDKVLSEVAEKRLRAIKEFTEFGSGFKIAMRDLEIRGAGNLLGIEQHGHIESIGYDLYAKYLGEAVRRLKGEEIKEIPDTTVELKVDGFISSAYIQDEEQKIEIYKRIAAIESIEDYRDLIDELIDRFGDLPKAVENLMNIAYIRALAMRNSIKNITQVGTSIRLDYDNADFISLPMIQHLTGIYGLKISFDMSKDANISLIAKGEIINRAKELLEEIDNFAKG